jgi:hypothetical protein
VKAPVQHILAAGLLLSAGAIVACARSSNAPAPVAPAEPAPKTAVAPPPSAPHLVTPATAMLAPSKRIYVARIFSEGQAHRLGFRTLELADGTYDGAKAWLLMDSRKIGTVELAESLYVAKATLEPLHRVVHTADQEIVTHYRADSVVTTFSGDSGVVRVALPGERDLVGNIYWLEPLFASLPLANGWKGSATTLFVGPNDHARVVMQLEVVGEENVFVPDGHFDCWMVNLQVGETQEHLWVRKSDRVLIKQDTPVAGIAGAKVELLLAEGQTKKVEG